MGSNTDLGPFSKPQRRSSRRNRSFLSAGKKPCDHWYVATSQTKSAYTSRQYRESRQGTYELSYFFSSKVMTRTGTEVSSTAIRAMLRELIAQENPQKPLSDQKLVNLLLERNIKVARRTVTKYRESMSIPSSTRRMDRPLEAT